MNYVTVKVQVKGIVKDVKQGTNKKGNPWYLLKLESGKGTENILINSITLNNVTTSAGDEVTLNGEMWKDKSKNYNYVFKNMNLVNIIKKDIPF